MTKVRVNESYKETVPHIIRIETNMFIKICGITNIDDANIAVKFGASALGFIFAKSKRQISPEKAARIICHLPQEVEKAGVFVNEQKDNIIKIAEQAKLTSIQLHGEESQELCDELGKKYKIIKAVKIDPTGSVISKRNYSVWKILLDTWLPNIQGGSGTPFQWESLQQFDSSNIIVAGGISSENIEKLLSECKPFGIDVCSGVEVEPGRKDHQKLKILFDKIRISLK